MPACPVCQVEMKREPLEEVTVDVCAGHGVWLEHGELFLITEHARYHSSSWWEDLFRREIHPPVDHSRELHCPVCATRMKLDEHLGVYLDWCHDHGVWLDSGEIEAILNNLRLDPFYVRGVALRLSELKY